MSITEAQRHHLLVTLEAVLGKEDAMTLAAHLPPVGWADVATTADLERLETSLRSETQALRSEMEVGFANQTAALRSEIVSQTRYLALAFFTAMLSFGGLLVAAGAVTG